MKIYEIPGQIRRMEELIEEAEGEITPEIEEALSHLEDVFAEKLEYLALLSREKKAEAAAWKQEEARIAKNRRVAENAEKNLKGFIQMMMENAGIQKIEGERAKLRIQRNGQPSIDWAGEKDAIPEGFRKVSVTLDSSAVKEHLAAGGELPEGIVVEYGTHVRIS